MFPKQLEAFYGVVEKWLINREYLPGKSGRHMKYPYTFTAKVAQFPIFFYLKKNWIWMYYPLGWAVGLYLISFIDEAARSDANKKNWAETQRRLAEKEEHH